MGLPIGRTARAGAAGVAIAFCADDEKAYLRDIEKLTRQKIAVEPLPAGFLAEAARIKSSRVESRPSFEERLAPRHEDRGHRRPHKRRAPHSDAVRPMGKPRRRARG